METCVSKTFNNLTKTLIVFNITLGVAAILQIFVAIFVFMSFSDVISMKNNLQIVTDKINNLTLDCNEEYKSSR